jgi:hypothetical protein
MLSPTALWCLKHNPLWEAGIIFPLSVKNFESEPISQKEGSFFSLQKKQTFGATNFLLGFLIIFFIFKTVYHPEQLLLSVVQLPFLFSLPLLALPFLLRLPQPVQQAVLALRLQPLPCLCCCQAKSCQR